MLGSTATDLGERLRGHHIAGTQGLRGGGLVRIQVLGQIEATVDGRELNLGGPKPRLALAMLLLEPNRAVSTDRLVDALWGDERPVDPRAALQVNLSNLRREFADAELAIEHRNGGYVARLDPDAVDMHRFTDLVSEGSRIVPADPRRGATVLRDALGLWRGRPFGDLADEPALVSEVARLEETRLRAVEKRVAADLSLGDHERVLEELQPLTREHPLREGFWVQLMLALYRCGRQVDALAAYDEASRRLREDLGLDPSPALRDMQAKVLRQDASLEVSPAAAAGPADEDERTVRGYTLYEEVRPGRLGTVHRGRQPGTDAPVAVEVIDVDAAADETLARCFGAVTERITGLDHDDLATLVDAWRGPRTAYLVSEWVDGEPLDETLRDGPWEPERLTDLVEDVASVLDHVHGHGETASDLRPRDIVVDHVGRPVLTGLAASTLSRIVHGAQEPDVPGGERPDVARLARICFRLLTGYPTRVGANAGTASASPTARGALPPLGEVRPDLPVAIGSVLARATSTDASERYGSATGFAQALRTAATGDAGGSRTAQVEVRNPYKGLQAFREADVGDYFGRGDLVLRLIAGIEGASLAVVGPSGSGKSSVVRAGLIPQLRERSWFVATMQPGEWPMAELERALSEVATCEPEAVAGALRTGDDGLIRAVDVALPDSSSRVLLFVDQFEEVYSLARREDRTAFLRRLSRCLRPGSDRIRVVLTIRADFYDELLLDPEIGEWVANHTVAVTPLSASQIEAAITGPAGRVGVGVESEVTATIVDEVAGAPGSLPLLQFALTELFEARDGGMLTLDGYEELGGISGALGGRSERLYAGLDQQGQQVCRQIFLRLVTLSGTDTETRRRVLRAELLATGPADTAEHVLETFGRHRLLTFDRDPFTRMPTVEVAHEALTQGWGRLRGWIDGAREDIAMHRRLLASADEWRLAEHDPSYLLRGSRLEDFERWSAVSAITLTDVERRYLDESLRARDEREAADLERLAREADLERRASRRLRVVAATFLVAALVATGLSVFAFRERGRAREQQAVAEEQTRIAHARELAAASTAQLDSDPHLSILLGIEAVNATRTEDGTVLPEAESALHHAVVSSRLTDQIVGIGGHLASSPDGSMFVTEGPEDTGLIDIRDTATGETIHAFHGHDRSVGDRPPDLNSVAFSHDGSMLATAGDDGTVRIWDRVWDTGGETESLIVSGDGLGQVWGPSFSPDGQLVAAAWTDEGVVRVVDLATGEVTLEIGGLAYPYAARFDPAGERLGIPLGRGDEAIVVDAATGERLLSLPGGSGRGLTWSPDGQHLATTVSIGAQARIWDAEDGTLRTTLFGHTTEVASAAWTADSQRLATGSLDGTVRVWRLAEGGAEQEHVFAGATKGVQGLTFLPDGDVLLAGEEGAADTTNVRFWDVTEDGSAEVANLRGAQDGPPVVDYGETGDRVAVSSGDRTVTVWDLATGDAVFRTQPPDGEVDVLRDLAHSPDGSTLAVAVGDRIQLWDGEGDLVVDVPNDGLVGTVGWSPDGALVATGDQFGFVRVLDRDGTEVARLDPPDGRAPRWSTEAVAFHPDGELLAVSGGDGTQPNSWHIELWDWAEEEVVDMVRTNGFNARRVAFDPAGERIATAGFGAIEVYDVASGQRIVELAPDGGGLVGDIAFHPEGDLLAAGGGDGTIRLWDVESGRDSLVLRGPGDAVGSLAFGPDGSRLVAGDRGGQVRVWTLDLDELLEIARDKVSRDLTAAECQRYLRKSCPSR